MALSRRSEDLGMFWEEFVKKYIWRLETIWGHARNQTLVRISEPLVNPLPSEFPELVNIFGIVYRGEEDFEEKYAGVSM